MGIHVNSPGMLSTVQDLGRWGFQNLGVPVAGPMDRYSHRFANALLGNPLGSATLEVTLLGPELSFGLATRIAVTGAEFELALDEKLVPMNEPVIVAASSRLCFGERRLGARAYLAVEGGFDVPEVLGSRSTHLPSQIGGMGGRALLTGDVLHSLSFAGEKLQPPRLRNSLLRLPCGGARIRVMLGPQERLFTPSGIKTFYTSRYVISNQSNRMGYRLDGPPISLAPSVGTLSDATPTGTIQVPGSGQPIILMADHQTTGGYPQVATVISADVPIVAQLAPSAWVEFQACDLQDAIRALIAQERALMN